MTRATDEGGRWLRQARADLRGAEILLEGDVFHLACFVSQQVAVEFVAGKVGGEA